MSTGRPGESLPRDRCTGEAARGWTRSSSWKPSDRDIDELTYCVNELISRRRRANIPVPGWMTTLGQRMDLRALSREMSCAGHQQVGVTAESETFDPLIGTREAAVLLGLSNRQVRRIAADIGGENVSGRMLFKRSAVVEFAKSRHDPWDGKDNQGDRQS